MAVGDEDFRRLETKVDRLTDAITTLVRVEERQATHGQRIGQVEEHLAKIETTLRIVDRKVDSWINRGIGIWALACVAWTIYLAMGR